MKLDDLPDDFVMVEIINRLPIVSIIYLGVTSKKWNDLLKEVQFPLLAPWCLVTPDIDVYQDELGEIPAQVLNLNNKSWSTWYFPGKLVASSKGYIVLENVENLILYKPCCNDFKLRSFPKSETDRDLSIFGSLERNVDSFQRNLSLLVEDTESDEETQFKILIEQKFDSNEGPYRGLELHDSRTNTWTAPGKSSQLLVLKLKEDIPLTVETSLYYLSTEETDSGRKYYVKTPDLGKSGELQRKRGGKRKREECIFARENESLTFVFLHNHNGWPMFFGGIRDQKTRKVDLYVWKLDKKKRLDRVMKVPNNMLLEIYPDFNVFGEFSPFLRYASTGDYFCLFDNAITLKILVCNLTEKRSHLQQMPESILRTVGNLRLYMFDPWLELKSTMSILDIDTYPRNSKKFPPFKYVNDPS